MQLPPTLARALLASALVAGSPGAGAQSVWSQSVDATTVEPGNSVGCGSAGVTADNGYWRSFDPPACGYPVGTDFEITQVVLGIEHATAGGGAGQQPIGVRLWQNPAGAPPAPGQSVLLASQLVLVADQSLAFQTVTLTAPVAVCNSGGSIDVEIDVPDAFQAGTQHDFLIGSNGLGETAPSYMRAAACGLPDPVPLGALGFPSMHLLIDLVVQDDPRPAIGAQYCVAEPNSTGQRGAIRAYGSVLAANDDVRLEVCLLPPNQFGYFILNTVEGFIPHPAGSAGNFCLGGGPGLGRYDGMVQNSGSAGTFGIQLDLNAVPINVLPGTTAVQPGDTYFFQCWYRDVGNTNNFTDGVRIDFL